LWRRSGALVRLQGTGRPRDARGRGRARVADRPRPAGARLATGTDRARSSDPAAAAVALGHDRAAGRGVLASLLLGQSIPPRRHDALCAIARSALLPADSRVRGFSLELPSASVAASRTTFERSSGLAAFRVRLLVGSRDEAGGLPDASLPGTRNSGCREVGPRGYSRRPATETRLGDCCRRYGFGARAPDVDLWLSLETLELRFGRGSCFGGGAAPHRSSARSPDPCAGAPAVRGGARMWPDLPGLGAPR